MEGGSQLGLQLSDEWEVQPVGTEEDAVDACFANGLATDNPWPGELIGHDSGDRVVEARVDEINFYQGLAAVVANSTPQSAVGVVISSTSKNESSVPLEMVPYVHPEELLFGVPDNKGGSSVDNGKKALHSEGRGGTGGERDFACFHEDIVTERVGKVLLPTAGWDERMKGMEEMLLYVRGMKDYAGKLEDSLYKIAILACQDAMLRGSVGSLIPSEVLQVARKTVLEANGNLDGVIGPVEMQVLYDSMGITCHVKYNCAFGTGVCASTSIKSCMNESCAQNRYPNPNVEDVWNLTRWIEKDATVDDLSMCWHDPQIGGMMPITGLEFKRYIEGTALGVNMLAAFTNLLRQMENCAYVRQPRLRTIHYVNHQWASLVAAGMLSGNASVQAFYTPKPSYLISPCTVVVAPICLKKQWFCYNIDFQNRVVSVMDPNFGINTSKDFSEHHKIANLLLKESARCMNKLGGNNNVGNGEWRGVIMLPRHCAGVDQSVRESFGWMLQCMMGFNGDYICYGTDELTRSWERRKMVYNLLQIGGNFGVATGIPNVAASKSESDHASSTGK